ncbi:TolC family protein [Mariniphaga sediminis]|uniref:TolC family protein n=1 Tax=Mariniphaga sediminis TaxID=1628158 RepID=A0A399D156_9BACT|nr:TolC family protein [Mariniphaga sediminis]RIH64100.1 TolC family protein [Mariniphaga sediminis]
MKTVLLLILLLNVTTIFAQPAVSLDDCYTWARENYPNLKQVEIWQEITSLKMENIQTNYLPQVMLNGQATYQSDVTKVDISMPGISIPSVSNDQYKAYAELKQSIWDGGITAASAKMEEAVLQSTLCQVEVELYKLNEQVSQAFFTALAMDKQKEVLAAQKKVLLEKLKAVQSGVENQMLEKTSVLVLEAEILNLEQNELQLEAGKRTAIQMLSILTGITIDKSTELKYNTTQINAQSQLSRPELELFEAQKTTLEKQNDLLTKSRNPKIFGFGQAGYGRPGLNMLNENFDAYYVVGLGVSWNAFDWKKTSRQKQVLRLQSEMISKQEETFNQNISLLLAQQNEQIGKLEELLKTDSRMVTLRTEIAQSSASKLENETITTTDYIQDVQAETIAKLNAELHRIQLNEAKEKYNLIKGKGVQ